VWTRYSPARLLTSLTWIWKSGAPTLSFFRSIHLNQLPVAAEKLALIPHFPVTPQGFSIGAGVLGLSWLAHKITGMFGDSTDTRNPYNHFDHNDKLLQQQILHNAQNINLFARNISYNMYHVVESFNTAYKRLTNVTSTYVKEIAYANARQALFSAEIVQELGRTLEVMRMDSSLQSCSNRQLPPTAITPTLLTTELAKLNSRISNRSYEQVVPVNRPTHYYTTPLTRCTVSKAPRNGHVHHMEVTILLQVPIQFEGTNFRLAEVITVPFVRHTTTGRQVCRIDLDHHLVAIKNGHPIPLGGLQVSSCDLNSGSCYVSEFNSIPSRNVACSRVLLTDSTVKDIMSTCHWSCDPARDDDPTVVSVSSSSRQIFAFTNFKKEVVVSCPYNAVMNRTMAHQPLSTVDFPLGAVFVKIPCNCYVVLTPAGPTICPLKPCNDPI